VIDRSQWQPALISCADGSDRLIAAVLCDFATGQFVVERVVRATLLPAPGEQIYMGKYLKTIHAVHVDPDRVTVYHYR
jgi:hypothetical protein